MFSYIQIKDFCNFIDFEMEFEKLIKESNKPNLNVLIGKNGSGKSCLLDALFEIASNNLFDNNPEQDRPDATSFEYLIRVNKTGKKNILCEKPNNYIKEHLNSEERKPFLWHKVFRFYTGSTQRQTYDASNRIYDITENDSKWILASYFLSGYLKPNKINELWQKIFNLASGCKPDEKCETAILPKILWIETEKNINEENAEKEEYELFNFSEPIYKCYTTNGIKYFWEISKLRKKVGAKPLKIFEYLYNSTYNRQELSEKSIKLLDTGFLYSHKNEDDILFPEQTLSDGELGLLRRFALLMMLREENQNIKEGTTEKYLVLLDEPETHFNEYWKTYFMSLVEEILAHAKVSHDVFIATHSAMLVTDVKTNEMHRLYKTEHGGIKKSNNYYQTFGGNIIDIGKTLFQMESDIGERSKNDVNNILSKCTNSVEEYDKKIRDINNLLSTTGPGEYRWKLRYTLKECEKELHKKIRTDNINHFNADECKICLKYIDKVHEEDLYQKIKRKIDNGKISN